MKNHPQPPEVRDHPQPAEVGYKLQPPQEYIGQPTVMSKHLELLDARNHPQLPDTSIKYLLSHDDLIHQSPAWCSDLSYCSNLLSTPNILSPVKSPNIDIYICIAKRPWESIGHLQARPKEFHTYYVTSSSTFAAILHGLASLHYNPHLNLHRNLVPFTWSHFARNKFGDAVAFCHVVF